MAADGEGEFGGGSVNWSIDVNNGDPHQTTVKNPPNPKGYIVKGTDKPPAEKPADRYFLVTLENPTGMKVEGNKITFKVPAKNSKGQVVVKWIYTAAEAAAAGLPQADVDLATELGRRSSAV